MSYHDLLDRIEKIGSDFNRSVEDRQRDLEAAFRAIGAANLTDVERRDLEHRCSTYGADLIRSSVLDFA